METRRFGRTGIQISRFTLGGGAVGGIMIDPAEEIRLAALQRALAAGCNWIDTAASYGDGESERTLGRLLPQVTPRPHLSTKVGVDTGDLNDLEGQIRRSLENSLTRLQTDRVDLFQLHNRIGNRTEGRMLATSELLRPGGIADIFDKLREEGYFTFHGLTALGETASIVEVIDSGRFDTAQVYFNLLNPSAARPVASAWGGQDLGGILDVCKHRDVGTMNIRVLAAGALADPNYNRDLALTSDMSLERERSRARNLFEVLGDRYGTRAQTAIRYAIANDELATIIVGMATLDHLEEALAAFDMGPLPDEALPEIDLCYEKGL